MCVCVCVCPMKSQGQRVFKGFSWGAGEASTCLFGSDFCMRAWIWLCGPSSLTLSFIRRVEEGEEVPRMEREHGLKDSRKS